MIHDFKAGWHNYVIKILPTVPILDVSEVLAVFPMGMIIEIDMETHF